MRKVFVALAFVAIIVSATLLPQVKQQISNTFTKLNKTKAGKNIITAIQLEISSKNKENIVARILALVNELLNEDVAEEQKAEADLASTEASCESTRLSYESQIESKKADIAGAQAHVPVVQGAIVSAEFELASNQEHHATASAQLADAHAENEAAVAAFEKSQRNHAAMVDALAQARALIVQLQSNAFLQKNNVVLAQMQTHHKSSMKSLESHASRGIFSLLMKMAQDVGIQADQQLVGDVLSIIDDLSAHESSSASAEQVVEGERVAEYNARVVSLTAEIDFAASEISRLEAELVAFANDLAATLANIESWSTQQAELEELLENHNAECDAQIANYHALIAHLNEEIDVIQQVIVIFESQAISDIAPLVDGLEL